MKVFVVPLTGFVHGPIDAVEGRVIEIEESVARDLELNGLVRIRFEPPVNKAVAGKVADDGAGRPSSVSPPAPVSPPKTSPKLKRGVVKKGKKGR